MDITSLIIQLIVGAVGGNAAGKAMPDKSLGTMGNTIAGAIGGLGGGQLLDMILGGGAMATDAEIDALYESTLKPRLESLEGLRREVKSYIVKAAVVVGVPAVLLWGHTAVAVTRGTCRF